MARVLILTGDAAEELDSMYPVFRLREGEAWAALQNEAQPWPRRV